MAKEKNIDLFVAKLLDDIKIRYSAKESGIKEVDEALKTASKRLSGKRGEPEFIAVSKDFLIVIEDKRDINKHILYDDENSGIVSDSSKAITDYAINGSLHYARHIIKNTSYKKIFAIGVSGDMKHHTIQPVFVGDDNFYKILDPVETFENFSEENIQDYFEQAVENKPSRDQKILEEIGPISKKLHEDLWKYGALRDSQKPLVVSAILLALEDKENFKVANLNGSQTQTDGKKILNSLKNYLDIVEVQPEEKKNAILHNFTFIQTSKELNTVNEFLNKTPLKHFTEYIVKNLKGAINHKHSEDILGRFYSEFVKFGGGDGQTLGIVLTPKHITDLFCDLLEINPNDVVFDPCCGTAGFLIAAMHKMILQTSDTEKIDHIRKHQLYGIEIKDDLFTIATTNMILRGDGKSNLRRLNFLEQDETFLKEIGATVGMMNPPYSQSKDKETRHLSELNFIYKLLNSMQLGGRVAVIVPQSAMIGKTKEDQNLKNKIYKEHSLKSVITLNKNTFYGIGVNPCIAIFTAHIPHEKDARCKFFNFDDDGYIVSKHIGLIETETAKDRRKKLLDCYFDKDDAPSKFMVKTTVEPSDEWLHSFYYFNDEIPKEEEFMQTMADYLTFEFNMITHGRGYLFGLEDGK